MAARLIASVVMTIFAAITGDAGGTGSCTGHKEVDAMYNHSVDVLHFKLVPSEENLKAVRAGAHSYILHHKRLEMRGCTVNATAAEESDANPCVCHFERSTEDCVASFERSHQRTYSTRCTLCC